MSRHVVSWSIDIFDAATATEAADGTTLYRNFYVCPCGETWEDVWSCACNDRCPACNKEIEPSESEEVEP